ncbi:MAG: CYTH domain-containing protein [Clostridiales Family XIII bacterium]|nr:CYTH domain-containing protein [Clostridiales Family XIII bacterium]
MEIELKYGVSAEAAALIWEDEYIRSIEEKDSRERIYMKAAYFDTDDRRLLRSDVAFRVRMEGNRIVASLKWNGSEVGGLHTREEINVPIDDETCFIQPDPAIFRESGAGKTLLELLEDSKLHSVFETNFLRSRVRVDTGGCICEVSVDEGEIVTDFGNLPIRELEIELFSGEQAALLQIGEKLAGQYSLAPESRTKYERGLQLLKENGA